MFGKSLRLGVVAASVAMLFAVGGWMVASNWAARADARPAPRATTKYNRTFGNIFLPFLGVFAQSSRRAA